MKTQSDYFQESENLAKKIEIEKQIAINELTEFRKLSFSEKRKAIRWAKSKFDKPVYDRLNGSVSKKLRNIFDTMEKEDELTAYMSITGTINVFFNYYL